MGGEGHYNLFLNADLLLGCYSRTVAILSNSVDGGEQ